MNTFLFYITSIFLSWWYVFALLPVIIAFIWRFFHLRMEKYYDDIF